MSEVRSTEGATMPLTPKAVARNHRARIQAMLNVTHVDTVTEVAYSTETPKEKSR